MSTWPTVSLLEAVADVTGGNPKVPQGQYRHEGRFPVVDQGQSQVAGFVDDESLLFKGSLPVLLFGDHTRAFKYRTEPFVLGADGVKALQPLDGFDGRFLLHYLGSRRLPNAGYSRHFKYLKEVQVPKPSLSEQRRIAEILDQTDALVAKRRQSLALLDQLTQSVFVNMFGDPTEGENAQPLDDWIDRGRPLTYGILMPGPDTAEGVPYVRVVDMKEGGIDVGSVRRTARAISDQYRRSILQTGDLLISIRGHVGRLARVPEALDGANITQDSARIATAPESAAYVLAALRSLPAQRWMERRIKGVAVRGINLGDLRQLPIRAPALADQIEFSRRAAALESHRTSVEASLEAAAQLRAALTQRAFAGLL